MERSFMGNINAVTDLLIEEGVAVLTIDSPPVNALSTAVRQGVCQALQAADAAPDVKAILLICGGRTFFAGADISEFGKPPQEPRLHDMLRAIENSSRPVIAAIHGSALGGGLETALACHYRIATAKAQLGLPEVKLGLVPGAGGTQRLPRLIGVGKALEMTTSGAPASAETAFRDGLVDAIAPESGLRQAAIAFAHRVIAQGSQPPKLRDRQMETVPENFFIDFRKARAAKFRGADAPEANIRCIEAAVAKSFEEGLAYETETFETLLAGDQSKALRHIFFAERQAARIPGLPNDGKTMPISRIGVVGAGTMGGGIAMNFLSAGFPVTIVETNRQALDRGVSTIRKNYESSAARGRIGAEDVGRSMGLLRPTLVMEDLADCDLIIEAVFEDMAVKKEIFAQLDGIAPPRAILATNTSYLDVNEIAAATSRPETVLGLHFFSPANIMRLVEVIRGTKTDPQVLASAMALVRRLGKVAVVSGVCFGFIGNRMLRQRQREATKLIIEGAMPWDVDRVLCDFGFPMGPFQMSDLAGLDVGWSKAVSRGETVRDRLCELDRRGQKTGAGFYDYDEKRSPSPSPLVERLILDFAAQQGASRRSIDDQEILERCLYPMINEGARILEEGIAYRSSDIDVVWVNGYGWPGHRGGPMFYADRLGLRPVRDRLRAYEAAFGSDFTPAALLDRLADEEKGFASLAPTA